MCRLLDRELGAAWVGVFAVAREGGCLIKACWSCKQTTNVSNATTCDQAKEIVGRIATSTTVPRGACGYHHGTGIQGGCLGWGPLVIAQHKP